MTTDQYTALKAWIAEQEPGQTAEQLHAALHTPSVPTRQLVPRWRVKEEMYCAGTWPLLLQAQANADPQIAGLAATVVAYLSDPDFENLDIDRGEVAAMLASLQAAGLLTTELAATIDGMADTLVSPAADLAIRPTLLDVIRAQREVQS